MSDALINGLAGAGGGIIAQLLTYPLQTVNARQQTERDPSKPAFKDGAARQLYLVVKNEGWERLYGGLMPSLVGTAASQGVYYYFYQIFRNRAEARALERSRRGLGDGSVGMLQSLTVAALSGCVNVLLTNPIWVVVTRMQTHRKANKQQRPQGLNCALDKPLEAATAENAPYKTIDVVSTTLVGRDTLFMINFQELYKESGVLGFWKGVIPALIMVSNPAIQFMLYETLLKKLKKRRASNFKGADGLTALEIFLLGAVAKLGATVVTYPLLVVKARLQAKHMINDDKRHRYKGTLDAFTKMVRYEGLSGMYKGMGTKIVQSVFASALLFMIKEELVKGARLLVTGNTSLVKKLPSKSSR
ncbi:Peroxisomal nicotinamide adenine dinucleotide carrier [Zea mays]|uniref:Peroxisomal nicotinamide adenine dinucleotide carrier n=1 Tax=Zea mays TaxID=4577 RepID=A0A1D6JX88_MAIZE|nr:Peroxisomal nicotinamide adenine dinucleotide carrier [Zea mays]